MPPLSRWLMILKKMKAHVPSDYTFGKWDAILCDEVLLCIGSKIKIFLFSDILWLFVSFFSFLLPLTIKTEEKFERHSARWGRKKVGLLDTTESSSKKLSFPKQPENCYRTIKWQSYYSSRYVGVLAVKLGCSKIGGSYPFIFWMRIVSWYIITLNLHVLQMGAKGVLFMSRLPWHEQQIPIIYKGNANGLVPRYH